MRLQREKDKDTKKNLSSEKNLKIKKLAVFQSSILSSDCASS